MYMWIRKVVIHHQQVLKFLISGGTATLVNLITLHTLISSFGVFYLTASAVSFVFAFLVSFSLQKFWTFEKKNLNVVHRELVLALTVALTNLGINTFLMYFFVEYVQLHYIPAQLCTSALIACETYVLYQKLIFAVKK